MRSSNSKSKTSRRRPRSSDDAELGHFTLLFCRGRRRNTEADAGEGSPIFWLKKEKKEGRKTKKKNLHITAKTFLKFVKIKHKSIIFFFSEKELC